MAKVDDPNDSTLGVDGLVRFFAAVALVLVLPWQIISASTDGHRNHLWIPCLLVAAWSGTRLAFLIAAGVPRLFEFTFMLFCYIFLGIAPAAQIHGNDMPSTTPGLPAGGDARAVLVVVVGIAAFEFGALVKRSWAARPMPASSPDASRSADYSAVSRSLLLLAITAPFAAYFILTIGPANFFTNRYDFTELALSLFEPTVLSILRAISWVPALVVVHRIIGRRITRNDRLNGSEMLAVAVAAIMIAFTNNPFTSSRYAFGSMALSLVVLFGGFATVKRTRRSMILLIVGFLLVFPLADTFRRPETAEVTVSVLDEYSGNPDYDSFAQISNAVQVVDDRGFTYLTQPAGVVFFWVPRSLWSDKPDDTGVFLAEDRGYDFKNLSAPLWAELYLIGGLFTVVIGFFAFGYGAVGADRRMRQGLRGERSYSVTGAFMPFYMLILLRGSLLQAAALASTFFVAVWFTRPVSGRSDLTTQAATRPAVPARASEAGAIDA